MADITMCKGTDCHLKETCKRFTATVTVERQSYLSVVPYKLETKTCEWYWEDTNVKSFKTNKNVKKR